MSNAEVSYFNIRYRVFDIHPNNLSYHTRYPTSGFTFCPINSIAFINCSWLRPALSIGVQWIKISIYRVHFQMSFSLIFTYFVYLFNAGRLRLSH